MNPGLNWYEDCAVGDAFTTGGIVVTESLIQGFAGISGDHFDLHVDDEFARGLGFPGRVAHGILGLALTDGLKNRADYRFRAVASLGWNWKFTGAILVGDRIRAEVSGAGEARNEAPRPRHPHARVRGEEPARRGRAAGHERADGVAASRMSANLSVTIDGPVATITLEPGREAERPHDGDARRARGRVRRDRPRRRRCAR